MRKIVRIKDIAEKANVSLGTVDRVLHNRGRVSEKVRAKILKIVKELNYEPNLMARALVAKKQYYIAVLIPDYKQDSYWRAPKLGVEQAASELKKFGVVVEQFTFNPYDVKSYIENANTLTQSEPDGILLSPIFYHETLPFFEKWKNANIPFVLFNTHITEFNPLSYIGQDSYLSGMLVGKIMHFGQTDPCSILIAHIDETTNNAEHLAKKEQGVRNYFLQNNLDHNYKIIRVELNRANLSEFIKQLDNIIESTFDLKQIFVTTSKAYEIAMYLEQRRISHIKIIGYDLIPKNIHYLNKGNISFLINQNPKGQGFYGITQLADHLVFKKEVPVLKYLPLDIVTKENLNYFIEEDTMEI